MSDDVFVEGGNVFIQGGIRIEADAETRKGVYADNVFARTIGNNTMLDFITLDIPGDTPESSSAVLVARVYMSNETLVALREMLIAHTSSWTAHDAARANG